jgi:hypothetical protein
MPLVEQRVGADMMNRLDAENDDEAGCRVESDDENTMDNNGDSDDMSA